MNVNHHHRLTQHILIALVLGALVGIFVPGLSPWVGWMGRIFKLSLGMIVMPLILTSIIDGMGSIANVHQLEKLGFKSFVYFLVTTFMAIALGLFLVITIQPGARETPLFNPGSVSSTSADISSAQVFLNQIDKTIENPFAALANKNVLAIILFAVLFGFALTRIGPLGEKVFEINRAAGLAINKMVEWVMKIAPFGVFGLLVEVLATTGTEVFQDLSWYALCVVLGLSIHLFIVLPALLFIVTRKSPLEFFSQIRPALLVAFSTSSSNATLPVTFKCVEEDAKVDTRISRFFLPLGTTINMNGTALYEAVAAVFIAQLYGVALGFQGQVLIALTAALAAVGTAGIPAAGTVTMAMVLSAAGLPLEGVGLLLALDRPLDMCRTVVNVMGDAVGCVVLDKVARKDLEAA